jgi:hypothetical protein
VVNDELMDIRFVHSGIAYEIYCWQAGFVRPVLVGIGISDWDARVNRGRYEVLMYMLMVNPLFDLNHPYGESRVTLTEDMPSGTEWLFRWFEDYALYTDLNLTSRGKKWLRENGFASC